jgi:lysophospholipase L1-like esterase
MTAALYWLLLPVSAIQGIWLRRTATRLPGAAGERRGSAGRGERLRLLALGDSIIDGVGIDRIEHALAVQFARSLAAETGRAVEWRIEGESGLGIDDLLARLRGLAEEIGPDLVLVSVGVNDVTGLSSKKRWAARLSEFLATLNRHWPDARVLFAGLPPMERFPLPPQPLRGTLGWRAAEFDRIAREVIANYAFALHVPTKIEPLTQGFCEDGFHPSSESCTLWARELAVIESRRESV